MEKLTFKQLINLIDKHNTNNNIKSQFSDKNPIIAIAVVDNASFNEEYPLESRSYRFRSDNKYFLPDMGGNSLYASSIDGSDPNIRLDWYFGDWIFEYFYIEA